MISDSELVAKPIITVLYNTAFYVYKFRMNLINELQKIGYNVVVISPHDEYVSRLEERGIYHYPIGMSQYGMNPLREIVTTWNIYRAFRHLSPVLSLHYTIKPNTFGSIAASLAGVPFINNIAGAGKAFSDEQSAFGAFVAYLYRISLKKSRKVFFQNNDDMKLFLGKEMVLEKVTERIPGSGVDLSRFSPVPNANNSEFRFLFIGRLLKEKGILEYLEAAARVLAEVNSKPVYFEVVGELEEGSDFIARPLLEKFLQDDRMIYHGTVFPDILPSIISRVHCVVLPSYYREGIPRSLLEAAAMAKPIITTDNVGCREVVDEGVNGYKVPVRDPLSLAEAMSRMIRLSDSDRVEMGNNGRIKVVQEFDERLVLNAYLRIISVLVQKGDRA